jgi:hypothetical protein
MFGRFPNVRAGPPKSASQTLASRKFNVAIDLFVGQVDFRAFGDDKREAHAAGVGPLAFEQDALNTRQHQLTDRSALSSSLLL